MSPFIIYFIHQFWSVRDPNTNTHMAWHAGFGSYGITLPEDWVQSCGQLINHVYIIKCQ